MVKKHHDTAAANKAIVSDPKPGFGPFTRISKMIPQCGLESAPSDLIAWALVSFIRKQLSVGVKSVVATAHTLAWVIKQ